MASNPAPAAAPGPNTPPAGTPSTATSGSPQAPQAGGPTGLLAPVQPARQGQATFNLNPANQAGAAPVGIGTSSAGFHTGQTPQNNSAGTGGKQERSIIRAWLLAGAERWRKGGDARLKALDIKKEKARALQVKETRSVNRSEKIVGGNTNTGSNTQSNSGKSLNNKTSGSKGSNNSGHGNSGGGRGSNGNGGGPGRSGSGGSSGGRGPSGKNNGGTGAGSGSGTGTGSGGGRNQQQSNGSKGPGGSSGTGNGNGGKGSAGGKGDRGQQGPKGPAGGKGPNGSSGSSGGAGSSGGSSGQTPKKQPSGDSGSGTGSGKTPPPTPGDKHTPPPGVYSPGSNSGRPWKTQKTEKTPDSPSTGPGPNTPPVNTQKAPKTPGTPGNGPQKPTQPPVKGGGTKTPNSPNGTPPRPQQPPSPPQPGPKPPKTQGSRETGYRDGARAGTVAGHIKAYGHGVRDGWTDATDQARHEKEQLDQARADRKNTPQPQPMPKQVPPMPTHTPTNQAAQPVQVTGVTTQGVTLGAGADRTNVSHGEIRSLKQFERALSAKADIMTRCAEQARALQAHAQEQLKRITWLTEQARSVKGGDKLLGTLLKLEEAARGQARLADDIARRALRSAEACKVLLANVKTRYGAIYKAVVDSGLIAPAKMHYYKDAAHV